MMSKLKYRLIKFLVRHSDHDSLIGDFVEIYDDTARQAGKLSAARWYWFQVFRLFPAAFNHQFILWGTMFNNYLKTTYRNFKKHPAFSFINILGLTLGIACALLIFSFVNYELSIDSFHKDPETIFQVFTHENWIKNTTTPVGLGPEMKKEIPGVIAFTRFHWPWGENFLTYQKTTHTEGKMRFVDPSFFKVFNFPLLKGDPATVLKDPNSIIITPEIAKKYFGSQDPMGQVLIFNHRHPLTVTGILKTPPFNSTIRFNILIPIEFNIRNQKKWYMAWYNMFAFTFIKCLPETNPDHLTPMIAGIVNKHRKSNESVGTVIRLKDRYFLFFSNKTNVVAFSAIAVFILLIACFNFMNLSTVQSAKRAREIGMRKVAGAGKKQIILQFLGESIFLSFIAALMAVLLYILLLPLLKSLTGREIMMNHFFIILNTTMLAFFTGLVAGIYPAFFLSNFKVIQVIKDKAGYGLGGKKLRQGTVVLQFVLSILLIIGMMVVHQQTGFIQNFDIGYNKNNIVCVPMGGGSEKYIQNIKNELLKDARVKAVSATALEFPFFNWRQGGYYWEGRDPEDGIQVSYNGVDYNFLTTMEMTVMAGEDFIPGKSYKRSYIINEELAKLIGKDSVIGMTLGHADQTGKIVGVVKNFHFNSLKNTIEPLVLELMPQSMDNLLVRFHGGNSASVLSLIQNTWKKIIPQYPLRYSFLEDDYRSNMIGLTRTRYLLSIFSILAILISCLGLFGLSSYSAIQKTREIGLRKVLGASVFSIIRTISHEFIFLVLAANILVWPLAYYLLNQWLRQFAYRTQLSPGIFVLSGIFTLGISMLTICYQTIKAARANPINSLKYE